MDSVIQPRGPAAPVTDLVIVGIATDLQRELCWYAIWKCEGLFR